MLDFKKKYKASVFDLKVFDMSDFEKLFEFKKSRFGSFYSVKTIFFAFFVLF